MERIKIVLYLKVLYLIWVHTKDYQKQTTFVHILVFYRENDKFYIQQSKKKLLKISSNKKSYE